jgi:hypothetical protein
MRRERMFIASWEQKLPSGIISPVSVSETWRSESLPARLVDVDPDCE